MNWVVFAALGLASTRPVIAQHYVIRLDPKNRTAEIRIDDPEGEGYAFETLFPSGSIRDGVWDVVLDKVGGPYVGMRALTYPEADSNGRLYVELATVNLAKRRGAFPGGAVRRVPDQRLGSLDEGPLEPCWVTVEQRECVIGTHPADDDPQSVPAFTVMCNGEVRQGLWEENTTGKTAPTLSTIWPFVAERNDAGIFTFVVGSITRQSSHTDLSVEFELQNRNTEILPIQSSYQDEPSSDSGSDG